MFSSTLTSRITAVTILASIMLATLVAMTGSAQATETVRLEIGDDFQSVVNAHPAGTSFLIASGTHREQSVIPKSGDTFTGEQGAIMSGARELTDWRAAGDAWVAQGQQQEGFEHGTVLPGHEGVRHPEDLWIDDVRLEQVLSRGAVDADSWFFDYAADQIVLGVNPTGRHVETSTVPFAFGGAGVSGVSIDNLTVTRYATPAQGGAIGGHVNQRQTRDWTISRVTVTENHAWGIVVSAGMTVTNSKVVRNGQGGIAGSGVTSDGYAAPVRVVNNEIAGNLTLGFDWWGEGGGTKFVHMADMTFSNNWVHHNGGPGVWFDVFNTGATISSNLVEDNAAQGIFYEISRGATIKWNTVRRNSTQYSGGEAAAAIDISQSSDVLVTQNVVIDNPTGIYLRHDERRREDGATTNVRVIGNDVSMNGGVTGMFISNTSDEEANRLWNASGNVFQDNTFRLQGADSEVFSWGTNFWPRIDARKWSFNDQVVVAAGEGTLPAGAEAYQTSAYGADAASSQPTSSNSASHFSRG